MQKPKIMVSACLLGAKCRYDGNAKPEARLQKQLDGAQLIPFCPECLGELKIPRLPAEIQAGDGAAVLAGEARVLNRQGGDYTSQFIAGALATLEIYQEQRPDFVILKTKSPSCGVGRIYDGSFTGKLRAGDGVAAALLRQNNAVLYTEHDFSAGIIRK